MLRSRVVAILRVTDEILTREARMRCMVLARKYYPGKWCNKCNFSLTEGENALKSMSNAYGVLRK